MGDELTLREMGNHAARVLPEGWVITLGIEKDAGWVTLEFDGEEVEFPTNHESLGQCWDDALAYALRAKVYACPWCECPTRHDPGRKPPVKCLTCGHEFPGPVEAAT